MYVSDVKKSVPEKYDTKLHKAVYDTLTSLSIPFERVENDPAITMEDCVEIDKRLNCETVKTLFLCNRQKTSFYLFMTPANKPFVTKNFSHTLGISRVSFAPEELLWDMLMTRAGATTVLSSVIDTENKVKIVIDKEITGRDYIGLTDSTTTGYMKLKTNDVLKRYLPFTNHEITIIEI